jgi:hypothetical protein
MKLYKRLSVHDVSSTPISDIAQHDSQLSLGGLLQVNLLANVGESIFLTSCFICRDGRSMDVLGVRSSNDLCSVC